jgi:hypothetical protein
MKKFSPEFDSNTFTIEYKLQNLIDDLPEPERKELNFDMDLKNKAKLNNKNKSQFFAKYFNSVN